MAVNVPDFATRARFAFDYTTLRRLDPELQEVDLRLQLWSAYARPGAGALGFPRRWVTGVEQNWSVDTIEADRAVAQLLTGQMAAVMSNYFYLSLPHAQRALVYARLAPHLARVRPSQLNGAHAAPLGPKAFREDLDRARWTLKQLLRL